MASKTIHNIWQVIIYRDKSTANEKEALISQSSPIVEDRGLVMPSEPIVHRSLPRSAFLLPLRHKLLLQIFVDGRRIRLACVTRSTTKALKKRRCNVLVEKFSEISE